MNNFARAQTLKKAIIISKINTSMYMYKGDVCLGEG